MNLPIRKRTRLKGYDYSAPGEYFVTICTAQKTHLFGEIKNSEMHLSSIGKIVNREILGIASHYENIRIDNYVIMPNHIHMIIVVEQTEGNAFMHSAKKIIWQPSFHDHIIRGEKDRLKISEYINTNPLKWELDCFYNDERP